VSGFDRRGRDFYAPPTWVTEALLRHVRFRGPIWEPCCGAGAISTVLAMHGYDVISTDIAECGFGTPGVDFLACRSVQSGCRSIITNPPYGEAAAHEGQPRSSRALQEFLRHALALTATGPGRACAAGAAARRSASSCLGRVRPCPSAGEAACAGLCLRVERPRASLSVTTTSGGFSGDQRPDHPMIRGPPDPRPDQSAAERTPCPTTSLKRLATGLLCTTAHRLDLMISVTWAVTSTVGRPLTY
jgi:hypothetical protein